MTALLKVTSGLLLTALIGFSSAAEARLEYPQQRPHIVEIEGANLVLTFSAEVNVSASTAEIRDTADNPIPTLKLKAGDDGTGLKVPLLSPLRPGQYTVKWNAFSTDGRQSVGSYEFRIGPTPEPTGPVAQN
jgi:methionine-rich copper-binding protein CopC